MGCCRWVLCCTVRKDEPKPGRMTFVHFITCPFILVIPSGAKNLAERSFPEFILSALRLRRSAPEFILSFVEGLRMSGSEGFRVTIPRCQSLKVWFSHKSLLHSWGLSREPLC